MRTLAVILARGGSKRLPGKNIKELSGKPLIAWTIEFAKSVTWFDEIQVSTDSEDIAKTCALYGVNVTRLRPAELATDDAKSVDVVLDVLNWRGSENANFDVVALLQPTTPIRYLERWEKAKIFLKDDACEGVIGVSAAETHPYLTYRDSSDGFIKPWIPESVGITRSQDYPPAYAVNGSLYLVKVNALLVQKTFLPIRCKYVECTERVESIDIDTPNDWMIAEGMISNMKKVN